MVRLRCVPLLSAVAATALACLPDFGTLPDETGRRDRDDGDEGEGEGEGEAAEGEGEGEGEGEIGEGEGEGEGEGGEGEGEQGPPTAVVDRLDVVGGVGFSQGYGLALANDGTVAIAAEYDGLLPTINDFELPVREDDSCVIAVIDDAGATQWVRHIEPISQHGLCVGGMRFTDDNAALYVTGGANISATVFGFGDPDAVDFTDAYVARLNAATGDIDWLVDLPASAGLEVLAVNDGVVLVVSFTGRLNLGGVSLQALSGAGADIAVVKLEAETGAAVWGKVIGSTDDDFAVASLAGGTVRVGLVVDAAYHATGTSLTTVDDPGVAFFAVQADTGALSAPMFVADDIQELRIGGVAANADGSFHACGRQGPASSGFDDGWVAFVDATGAVSLRLNAGGGCNAMVSDGVGGAWFVDALSNFETSISYGTVSVSAPAGGGGNDIALVHVAAGVVDVARSFGGRDSDFASLLAGTRDRVVFGGDIRSEFTVDGVRYNPSGESDAAFFGLQVTR